MKDFYNNPKIELKEFNDERLLTASVAESANDKAAEALNAAGTTQNVTVKWFF